MTLQLYKAELKHSFVVEINSLTRLILTFLNLNLHKNKHLQK